MFFRATVLLRLIEEQAANSAEKELDKILAIVKKLTKRISNKDDGY